MIIVIVGGGPRPSDSRKLAVTFKSKVAFTS